MRKARLANLLIDTTDLLTRAMTPEEGWQAVNTVARRIGANAVNAAALLPGRMQPVWAWSSMHPDWLEEYTGANLIEVDPLVIGLLAGRTPEVFTTGSHLRPGEASLRDAQLVDGLAHFHYNHFCSQTWSEGAVTKLLVLSSDRDPTDLFGPGTDRALRAVSALLASGVAPPGDLSQDQRFGIDYRALAPRERDVLCLLAHGLSDEDIAAGLRLDVASVRLLMKSARRKMGAASREQALALAMARGLLDL